MKCSYYASVSWVKRMTLFITVFTLSSIAAFSQKVAAVDVSGNVSLGANNTDLSGTTVQVKGRSTAVSTDNKGHYIISVQKPATLVFSRVGFQNIEKTVNNENVVNVTLDVTVNNLDQVLVVSYGTRKQKDITGSVSNVNASAVQDVPAAEFGQKLQGKVAGLQLNQTSGRPGQGMDFRIRGAASLSSGFQPLMVVDGQPLAGVNSRNGDANLLNPDEIESFTVLKDASATALYGSRAANGVIIITTKQGKAGRTNVSLNAYTGWQTVPDKGKPDMMNAHEFATFMKGFYEDKAKYEGYVAGIPADYANPDQYGTGTNWYNALLRTAPMQNYSLNVSSGTDKFSSSTTLTYFDQQGVLLNTGMKRYALRSNNEFRPNDRLKIGLNIAPSYQLDHNTRNNTDGNRQVIGNATTASPLIANKAADGSYNSRVSSYGMIGMNNPVQQLSLLNSNQTTFRLLANLYGEVEIVKNLKFRSSLNTDLGAADYLQYFGSMFGIGLNAAPIPRATTAASANSNSYNYFSWLNENTLNYNIKVKNHNIDLLAGYSSQKWQRDYRTINGSNFPSDAVQLVSGALTTTGTNNREAWSLASAFGRVNYDFKGKYLFTATIRQDGSSRFGDNTKYGYFPSVSAGWIISDESFFPKNNAISYLKLRGSYGKTGNFNIGNYSYVSNITGNIGAVTSNYVYGGTLTPGLSITLLGNKNLTWEASTQTDLGIEMNLIHNRLTFSYDYYSKITDGMLYQNLIPIASGYASVTFNTGKFRMWGHEFQVSSKNLVGAFSWNTDFNISFNDNKVLSLPPNTPFVGGGPTYSGYNRSVIGRHIGEFYGYVFDGIYMTQAEYDKQPKYSTSVVGSTRMKDVDGNGVIDANDRTFYW
jgi:TonB-linked SusC/RagA family outer membrane protein